MAVRAGFGGASASNLERLEEVRNSSALIVFLLCSAPRPGLDESNRVKLGGKRASMRGLGGGGAGGGGVPLPLSDAPPLEPPCRVMRSRGG